ncbi:flavin reductase family protein [Mycobacterium koreense]|uniref:Monooxygenase n=1 Tax=Mycolicibacillus koreensis TaxID=1069220 RepID=A0A7I7SK87_9MYCO|nr:flavin reductase family protein [Mycolicibacillus koreensis]MCV7247227.1 flavin reductase family protein [Mycolicibacillus koreensis]ODR06657.1 monooxygenase [Mycolicibacillus koreensis]OSC34250.1 monooxygenase [Mycolicibacillus koreensis]BBY56415.1 monooxygenase [Mycolicibacillus koreensis]
MREDNTEAVALLAPESPAMRWVLGHFCTGIAVITGSDAGRPVGFTCQSLTSVSLDPPYVSFCPSRGSTSWPTMRDFGALCINILTDRQRDVCARFATSGGDKFAQTAWRPGRNGAPKLDNALAAIEADIELEYPAGDHTIVLARVSGLSVDENGAPLLFFRGGYGALHNDAHG